jgi:S-adenosylhomocysteine hydrolase
VSVRSAAAKPLTPARVALPASGQRVLLADLAQKTQTPEGQRALAELAGSIGRQLGDKRASLAPEAAQLLVADRFEQTVAEHALATRSTAVTAQTAWSGVAEALFHATDNAGEVDLKKLGKLYGPRALQLVAALTNAAGVVSDPMADRRALDDLSAHTRGAVAGSRFVAPEMSALKTLHAQVAEKDEFKGMQFLGLQHLFASSATLFDTLEKTGINPKDMHCVGKIYSTNYRVADELTRKGATLGEATRRIGSKDFAKAMGEDIELQLRAMVSQLPRPQPGPEGDAAVAAHPKVLLIDDGAEAIHLLHEKFPEYAPYFVCVEQTRRGARIIHELEAAGKLRCPVVNVAESWAKLEWESPMIGHSVVLEVGRKLDRLERSGVPAPKEALVMGCGAVGGGVARAMLDRKQDVHLYDKDVTRAQELRDTLLAEGFPADKIFVHADKREALGHAGLLVSCVGMRTLERGDHDFLPDGAVLVNAASADDELGPADLLKERPPVVKDDRNNLWTSFRGHPVNLGMGDAEAHSDAVVRLGNGKTCYLMNHGFVVNMTGERDPIPPRYIQLTRSLLFLGAVAAKRCAGKPGIHEVPMEWQKAAVNLTQKELRKTGEDLKKPNWETRKADALPPEDLGIPPAEVMEQARLEKLGQSPKVQPTQPQRVVDSGEVNLVGGMVIPPWDPSNRLYGLRLGRVTPGTPEVAIASLVEGSKTLTVEGAALYQAQTLVSRALGVDLRATLHNGDMHVDRAAVKYAATPQERPTMVDGQDTVDHRFQFLFGDFSHRRAGAQEQTPGHNG